MIILQDGSLATKMQIISSSHNLLFSSHFDLSTLFLGLGKVNSTNLLELSSLNTSSITVGHSIVGLIPQYGLLYVSFSILLPLLFIPAQLRYVFLAFTLSAGLISLFPISYVGLFTVIINLLIASTPSSFSLFRR